MVPHRKSALDPELKEKPSCFSNLLNSPLYGSLVHLTEALALLVEADAVGARLFHSPPAVPASYVATPGIAVPVELRAELLNWPSEQGSVFETLEGHVPTDDEAVVINPM